MYHNGIDSVVSIVLMLVTAWPCVRHLEWLGGFSEPRSLLPLLFVAAAATIVRFVVGDILPTANILAGFVVLFLAPALATSELLHRYRLRAT